MTVQELIDVIREIETCSEISENVILNDDTLENMHPLLLKATLLAQKVLLLDPEEGGRNYDAENIFEALTGFQICTLEAEGCPWYMGGIETAKGVIAYA